MVYTDKPVTTSVDRRLHTFFPTNCLPGSSSKMVTVAVEGPCMVTPGSEVLSNTKNSSGGGGSKMASFTIKIVRHCSTAAGAKPMMTLLGR